MWYKVRRERREGCRRCGLLTRHLCSRFQVEGVPDHLEVHVWMLSRIQLHGAVEVFLAYIAPGTERVREGLYGDGERGRHRVSGGGPAAEEARS